MHSRTVGIWCRQSGKSTSVSLLCAFECVTKPNYSIMMVAPSQEQSRELFRKVRLFIDEYYSGFVESSTQTELFFKNGSRIRALPSGPEGVTIRGYTADRIIVEESGMMKESIVNEVISPMIASKPDGKITQIGTPKGKNHFWNAAYGENSSYKLSRVTLGS